MDFQFDEAKESVNQERHGLSRGFGARIVEDADHLFIPTIREADDEDRYKLYTAVHVWRGDTLRFISVRRSNAGEERAYRTD